MTNSPLRRFSSPSIYIPLALALLACSYYLVLGSAVVDPWEALDLKSFRIFGGLLLLMVIAGVVRAAQRFREDGLFPLLSRVSALVVLLAVLTVYLFRFEGTMILAEGEAYEPIAAAFSDIRKGPLARVPAPLFVLASITPPGKPSGFTIIPGAGGRSVSSEDEVVVTDGVRIRLVKRGIMPLVELAAVSGGTLAREYVRLDLDSPTGQDSFMFVNNPYEFTVRRIKDSPDPGRVLLQVAARRGKLKIAEGRVDTRTPLKVADFVLTLPEVKRSAIFQMNRQVGSGIFRAACASFLAIHAWGAYITLRERRTRSREN